MYICALSIASNALSEAESLASQCQSASQGGETEAVQLDISDKEKLGNLVSGADVVVRYVYMYVFSSMLLMHRIAWCLHFCMILSPKHALIIASIW